MNKVAPTSTNKIAKRSPTKALEALLSNTRAPNTIKSYRSDLSVFCHWLRGTDPDVDNRGRPIRLDDSLIREIISSHNVNEPLLVSYLESISFRYKISTIERKMSALSWALPQICGLDLKGMAVLRETKKGLRRLHADYIAGLITSEELIEQGFDVHLSQKKIKRAPAKPMRIHLLKLAVGEIFRSGSKKPIDKRDAAILTLWWSGAFRRSELISLRVEDISFSEQGMKIYLSKSKTDQFGSGIQKGVHHASEHPDICPVRLMKSWLKTLGRTEGFLFARIHGKTGLVLSNQSPMSDKAMVNVLRNRLISAGLDEEEAKEFSGHSPRRGFVTDSYLRRASEHSIQKQGGWKTRHMIETYIEEDSVFENNATGNVL